MAGLFMWCFEACEHYVSYLQLPQVHLVCFIARTIPMSLRKAKLCQQRLPQFGVSSPSCKSSKQMHGCSRCIHDGWQACAHMPLYAMNVLRCVTYGCRRQLQ